MHEKLQTGNKKAASSSTLLSNQTLHKAKYLCIISNTIAPTLPTTYTSPTMFRQVAVRNARLFSTSVRFADKGPVEAAKDAVKTVDKNVSQTIVKGIEKGGMLHHHHRYQRTSLLHNNVR